MFLIIEMNLDQEITQVELIDVDKKIVILYGHKWLKPKHPEADWPSWQMMSEYLPQVTCGDPSMEAASPRA
jgi:hypothetical protein